MWTEAECATVRRTGFAGDEWKVLDDDRDRLVRSSGEGSWGRLFGGTGTPVFRFAASKNAPLGTGINVFLKEYQNSPLLFTCK